MEYFKNKYYYDNIAIQEKAKPDFSIRDQSNTKLNNTPGRGISRGLKFNDYEMKNKRSVWTITTKPFKESHFATFPTDLIEPMVLAGCPENGIIIDPFSGAGTTSVVAVRNRRKFINIELNPDYCKIQVNRLAPEFKKDEMRLF